MCLYYLTPSVILKFKSGATETTSGSYRKFYLFRRVGCLLAGFN